MKKLLVSIGVLTLSASVVIAGGDDRDTGPVESLDAMAPPSEQVLDNQVPAQAPETMKLTVGGQAVSVGAHIACQDKLGLSESNIAIFKKAQSAGYLYNTGPLDVFGTEFSPMRWDDYFDCVNAHGG